MNGINTCVVLVGVSISMIFISGGIHKIEEGNVGVYYRGGALINGYTDPGYNLMIPGVTQYRQIKYQVQSDSVKNVRCGTKDGVPLYFEKIEVVNKLQKKHVWTTIRDYTSEYDQHLIFKRIETNMESLCSKMSHTEIVLTEFDNLDERLSELLQKYLNEYAPGIQILSIRVSKPRVPDAIMELWSNTEMELIKRAIEAEKMKVTNLQQETMKKKALINTETENAVAKLKNDEDLYRMQVQQQIQTIYDEMQANVIRAKAEAAKYKQELTNEINKKKLTESFMKKQAIDGMINTKKTYFGDSIPQILSENMKILI